MVIAPEDLVAAMEKRRREQEMIGLEIRQRMIELTRNRVENSLLVGQLINGVFEFSFDNDFMIDDQSMGVVADEYREAGYGFAWESRRLTWGNRFVVKVAFPGHVLPRPKS